MICHQDYRLTVLLGQCLQLSYNAVIPLVKDVNMGLEHHDMGANLWGQKYTFRSTTATSTGPAMLEFDKPWQIRHATTCQIECSMRQVYLAAHIAGLCTSCLAHQ
jgi:hypothetical protein